MRGSVAPLARGVWGILATPFAGDDLRLDFDSLRRLVGLYRGCGASGVVALGVLGEAARLDTAERQAVLRTVVEAAGPMPVVAGMAALATAPAIEEAQRHAALGARAVMSLIPTADPVALSAHVRAIASAANVGVLLQDHPAVSGVAIPPVALARAAEAGCVVGIKAEAPPTAPTVAAVAGACSVPIFGGLGGVGLLDELICGSAGAMTGFALPEALVATVRAWDTGGYDAARAAYAPWLPLVVCEAQEKISLAVRKEILRRRGIISDARVRPPGIGLPASMGPVLAAHLAAVVALVP